MPPQVASALAIELAFIFVTSLLVVQPAPLFRGSSERARERIKNTGYVFLCLTFCWSVVFGCILALNSYTFKI